MLLGVAFGSVEADQSEPVVRSFRTAVGRFQAALRQPKSEWTRDAAILRFEFTFELAWKAIAKMARREGHESASARRSFRLAAQLGWIEDDGLWLDMLEDRNRTTHTYNEAIAEAIYGRFSGYSEALEGLLDSLLAELED